MRRIFLDFSLHVFDISDATQQASEIASYIVDLIGTVSLVSAKWPGVPITVLNPPSTFRPDVAGSVYETLVQDLRYASRVVADSPTNTVSLLDNNWIEVQPDSAGTQKVIAPVDHLNIGVRMFKAILTGRDETLGRVDALPVPGFLFVGARMRLGASTVDANRGHRERGAWPCERELESRIPRHCGRCSSAGECVRKSE